MANIIEITELSIKELDVYAHLTHSQLRNRLEPEKGIFIAESPKVIRLALDAGCQPISLLMERRQIREQGAELIARCPDIPVYTGERQVLEKLTGYELTRGILSAMLRPQAGSVQAVCRNARRLAVLEGIVDATNIGAIFRSAAAMGMDGILVSPTCCDPLIRRAVRVSMGTVFQIPWAWLSEWPGNSFAMLKEMGFSTAAMALREDSVSLDHPGLMEEEKLAIILGAEGDGLAQSTIAQCDYTVRIPMQHGVDSLNVAAAGAVAFWQLRLRGPGDHETLF